VKLSEKRLVAFSMILAILISACFLPINVAHTQDRSQVTNFSITKLIDEPYYKETFFEIATDETTYHIIVKANITVIGSEVFVELNATLFNPHNSTITASARIADTLTDAPYYSGSVEAFRIHLEAWVVNALRIALPIVMVVAFIVQVYFIIEEFIAAPILQTLKTLLFGGPFIWASLPWVLLTLLQDTNLDGSFDLFVPYWPPWPHINLVLNEHYFLATNWSWWEIIKVEVYTDVWTPWGTWRIVWFTYFEARWVRSRILPSPPKIPPTASFYWTPAQPIVGEEVVFTSTSFDPDGFITSRQWWMGDGNQKTLSNFTYTYNAAGSYNVTLLVTDNDGLTGNVTHTINVTALVQARLRVIPDHVDVNVPTGKCATAEFLAGESLNQTDLLAVVFQASDFKNPDSDIISSGNVTFNKNGIVIPKGTYTNATITFCAPAGSPVGIYNGNVTISSDNGGNATIFVDLHVFGPPFANFTWYPLVPKVGETVTFDSSPSIPSGWPITEYKWDFGDGQTATGQIVTHTFTNPIIYTVALNITDSENLWDVEEKQIQVVAEYTLTIESIPAGVTFTADGTPHMTPWSGTFDDGTPVALVMPESYMVRVAKYVWDKWDDGVTSRSRTVTMNTDISLTAKFTGPNCQLTVTSTPITGIPFTINSASKTTPYVEWLPEGYYTVEMPQTYNGNNWSKWLEDGDTSRMKTIYLHGTTWTGVYVQVSPPTPPVGGEWIPINKFELLSPWISLVSLMTVLTMSFVYVRRKRRQN
jgi:PKD repeat protein